MMKIFARAFETLGSRAMKDIPLNYGNKKHEGVGNSPWSKIPNISSFTIDLTALDPLFALFGIKRRSSKALIQCTPYDNRDANRYIEHQILRLKKSRDDDPKLYWHMAKLIIKRSNTFRMLGINHVFRNWYKNYPLHFILNVNRKTSLILNKHNEKLNARRVFIKKGEKGYRPLGVPKPEWRLYLHLWSNFLVYFLEHKLPNQHGFLPGRGTLSAWKQIFIEKLMERPYIKEWDFKNYFNEIILYKVQNQMIDFKIPPEIADYLIRLNMNTVDLPEEAQHELEPQLDEDRRNNQRKENVPTIHMDAWVWTMEPGQRTIGIVGGGMKSGKKLFSTLSHLLNQGSKDTFSVLDWMYKYYNPAIKVGPYIYQTEKNASRGVAQGAATSPILANLIMDLWLKSKDPGETTVAYADDSITFSDSIIDKEAPPQTGIIINQEKSGWVKFAGKWIKPIKFLGLEYYDGKLKGATRKGSTLEFSKKYRFMDWLWRARDEKLERAVDQIEWIKNKEHEWDNQYTNGNSWEQHFKSKLIGFIQSRLYAGDWNLKNLEQDFQLKFAPKTWLTSKLNKERYQWDLNTFTASSYANYSLLNLLRWNQKLRKIQKPEAIVIRKIMI